MDDVVKCLRNYLAAEQLVRAPDVAGAGARPWLPVVYQHPDLGAIAPGDAAEQGKDTAADDGLVLSIFWAPGIPPGLGEEGRRRVGVDLTFRGDTPAEIRALEGEIRERLLDGPGYPPGGRCDWVMDGLYIIQSIEWRPLQPLSSDEGSFTFVAGYLFEIRA